MSYDSKQIFFGTLALSSFSFIILIIVTETNYEDLTASTETTAIIKPPSAYYVGLVATVPSKQRFMQYAFYAYLVAFRWMNLGFQPIFVLIAKNQTSTSEYLIKEMEKVAPTYIVYTNQTTKISQISRLFLFLHAEIRETDYIITTDSDLLPLKRKEYEMENWKVKATTSNPKQGFYSYLAMSNIVMSKQVWKEVMFFKDCDVKSSDYKKFKTKSIHAYDQVHDKCPDKNIFTKARFRPEYFNEYFDSHFGVSGESSKNNSNWFQDQQLISYRLGQWVARNSSRAEEVYYGRAKSPVTRLSSMDMQINNRTIDIHLADRPSNQLVWDKLRRIIIMNKLISEDQLFRVEKMRSYLCKILPK